MSTILVIDSAVSGEASVSEGAGPRGGRRPDRAGPRPRSSTATSAATRCRTSPRRPWPACAPSPTTEAEHAARALSDDADRRAARRRHHRHRRADVQLQRPTDAARRGSTTCCAPARPSATPRPGPKGLLAGKRVIVVESRGGLYSEGPAQAFDFQEPYLRHLLGFMGLTDVTFVRAEKIGFGPEARAAAIAAATASLRGDRPGIRRRPRDAASPLRRSIAGVGHLRVQLHCRDGLLAGQELGCLAPGEAPLAATVIAAPAAATSSGASMITTASYLPKAKKNC